MTNSPNDIYNDRRTLPLQQDILTDFSITTQCNHGAMRRVHLTVDLDVLLSCAACFDFMNKRGASDDSMEDVGGTLRINDSIYAGSVGFSG